MSVTLINLSAVPADQEEAFLAAWKTTAAVFKAKPGYIHTKLHRSLDPKAHFRFVNIGHWESREMCNRRRANA